VWFRQSRSLIMRSRGLAQPFSGALSGNSPSLAANRNRNLSDTDATKNHVETSKRAYSDPRVCEWLLR
jgi:hypothetical protein